MVNLALGHLLRSEGHAKQASAGMMFGGILNVVLDPVFIFAFHLDVAGAAIATALSNTVSVAFFIIQYIRLKDKTAISLNPRHFTFRFVRPVFSVGLASALATTLGNASNMVMVHLASGYGDIPVAAYGSERAWSAYNSLRDAYVEAGWNEIDIVLQIQTPDNNWFAQRGVTGNYHGGGNLVFDETEILEWVTNHQKGGNTQK